MSGRKVFITGGAKRLGREIALAFANNGAAVVIHYNKSKQEAGKLVEEIASKGNKACAVKADVRVISQIENAVNKGAKFLGGLDILLINNAAIFYKTPLAETSEPQWDDFLDINCRAPFFFAKFAAPFLKKSGHGRIINIADTYGFSPAASYVPYGISKAGVIALTKGLAKELAPLVLVNCVCPGVVRFPISDFRPQKSEVRDQRSEQMALGATLLKKEVEVQDVVDAVLFLVRNNSITGQAVSVDGGKNV
ncbi:MAG: SDR family oxidoreductase [Deltaproteobacteria bacterium]|nr:SDR family oxidoreductase [Deltaproteobacteria bacterium]